LDSLSQLVLGAAVGEAVCGKKERNRALIYGAIAGTIPDLDVIASPFLDAVQELSFHRSVTHSLLFCVLIPPLLGLLMRKVHPKSETSWRGWTMLYFWGFLTHIMLDCFTTWGTQVFFPFSDWRVAFKSIFVVDPLYTLPFLVLLPWVWRVKNVQKRWRLNTLALVLSSAYLLLTVFNKFQATETLKTALEKDGVSFGRYHSKPTPMNNVLWNFTAETDSAYYIGYHGFLDKVNQPITFYHFPKRHELLKPYENHEKVQKLMRITEGFYAMESKGDTLVMNDLRFGQLDGWETGEGAFVFAYYIYPNTEGELEFLMQRNSPKTGLKMLGQFFRRIFGDSSPQKAQNGA